MDPNANSGAVKGAYFSAAFILRSVASDLLDIDPDEIDISNVRQIPLDDGSGQTIRVGEMVLSDHLANGAGFVRWISEHWLELINRCVNTEEPPNTPIGDLISGEHRSGCDSSCYDCLRQYRNMSYHSLLDWRLGLSLIRMLHSEEFTAGLDGAFDTPDLEGWPDKALERRNAFCRSFNHFRPRDFGRLPGMEIDGLQVIVVQPLWDTDRPRGILAEARAAAEAEKVLYLDTFNLLRRESWCYKNLGG